MSQISFADAEYAGKRKKTRREVFLEEMELVVPWKVLLKIIEPHYPVAGPRPQAVRAGVDAAGAPDAELVCAERSGDGRGAVRDRLAAQLRPSEPERADSGRDDHPELPPPAGSQRPGRGHLKAVNALLARKGLLLKRAASWTPPSLRRPAPRRTPKASVTRRCTRPRRATSGSSG
jgi:IS5 family transposase